ncbi:hypothetical protein J6590_018295 [Homalodisca vitripennis]|nr:hypothetical protein J6590_018295 [Homalodisca vitripennis]
MNAGIPYLISFEKSTAMFSFWLELLKLKRVFVILYVEMECLSEQERIIDPDDLRLRRTGYPIETPVIRSSKKQFNVSRKQAALKTTPKLGRSKFFNSHCISNNTISERMRLETINNYHFILGTVGLTHITLQLHAHLHLIVIYRRVILVLWRNYRFDEATNDVRVTGRNPLTHYNNGVVPPAGLTIGDRDFIEESRMRLSRRATITQAVPGYTATGIASREARCGGTGMDVKVTAAADETLHFFASGWLDLVVNSSAKSTTPDFGLELKIAQVLILPVTLAIFISTIDVVLLLHIMLITYLHFLFGPDQPTLDRPPNHCDILLHRLLDDLTLSSITSSGSHDLLLLLPASYIALLSKVGAKRLGLREIGKEDRFLQGRQHGFGLSDHDLLDLQDTPTAVADSVTSLNDSRRFYCNNYDDEIFLS